MSQRPKILMHTIRNDYTSTNVTTAAYVQLSAALPKDSSHIEVFDSSGAVLVLAYGAVGSEKVLGDITPGGNTTGIPTPLCAGMRLAIKSIDTATVNTGQLVMNFYL